MSYIVKSSEKPRKSGAETETKALLYLTSYCGGCTFVGITEDN